MKKSKSSLTPTRHYLSFSSSSPSVPGGVCQSEPPPLAVCSCPRLLRVLCPRRQRVRRETLLHADQSGESGVNNLNFSVISMFR